MWISVPVLQGAHARHIRFFTAKYRASATLALKLNEDDFGRTTLKDCRNFNPALSRDLNVYCIPSFSHPSRLLGMEHEALPFRNVSIRTDIMCSPKFTRMMLPFGRDTRVWD